MSYRSALLMPAGAIKFCYCCGRKVKSSRWRSCPAYLVRHRPDPHLKAGTKPITCYMGDCRKAYHASLAQKEAIISSGSTSDGPIGSHTRKKKYKLKTSNPLKSAHQQRNDVASRFCMLLPIKLSTMPLHCPNLPHDGHDGHDGHPCSIFCTLALRGCPSSLLLCDS